MRYELTDLRLFLAIAEAGSLTGGANAVHLTASAASYRLKNLEFAMGVPLFTREARGMGLTPEGQFVLQHVRALLEGVERMHGEIGGFARGLKGRVRLFANSSSLNGFLVPSVGRFLSAHPNVDILLEEHPSKTIEAAVANQEADVGILAGQAESDAVEAMRYAVDELIIAAPLDHPVVGNSPVRLPAVLDLDFVCMSRESSNFAFLRDMARLAGKSPHVRIHAHAFDAVLALVRDGVGVALVPRSVARGALAAGGIAAVTLDEPWAVRELTLVRRKGEPAPFVRTVVDYLLNDPAVRATREAG